MPDNVRSESEIHVPADAQKMPPRLLSFIADNVYYFSFNLVLSLAIMALIISFGALTPGEIKHRSDLKRKGRIAYTNDVDIQVGGRGSLTVFYTFTYGGKSYTGKAFLPHEYSEKVTKYSKSGEFPVLFLPSDPTVNHPNDWSGNGPTPFVSFVLVLILFVQWISMARFVLHKSLSFRPQAINFN